ncbi:MAG: Xaa-Pro dipeptidase, partial [Deltaproteobacteria bacterium]|nr:Xaa-Pro dipeptidase [Deltaproteobacteria bacterium]
ERQLQAVVEFVFRAGGAARVGYGSIVARGDNATILHYTENDQTIGPSDLVLIDAGGEVAYQTADITRTFPASGKFSPEQRAVYQIVLRAELEAIALCTTEHRFIEVHDRAVRVLTEGLVELGLLQGEVDQLIADEKYKRFYMHRTSHWLGMDVHDCGRYHDKLPTGNLSRQFAPGMVLTVEPGLYIAADDAEVPERYRGIGIRIEDDILITAGAPEVLTAACIKKIEEIEATVGSGGRWIAAVDPAFGGPTA